MLHYRKRYFFKAMEMLRSIETDPDDLTFLLPLQMMLIDEISRAERNVRKIKDGIRNAGDTTTNLRVLERRLEGTRRVICVWRCFGDAIAFLYCDKHALKHAYFNTETVNPKQQAGFLSGKEGLTAEVKLLAEAISVGIPAILSDLTNTIRHGDVSLLGGPDRSLLR